MFYIQQRKTLSYYQHYHIILLDRHQGLLGGDLGTRKPFTFPRNIPKKQYFIGTSSPAPHFMSVCNRPLNSNSFTQDTREKTLATKNIPQQRHQKTPTREGRTCRVGACVSGGMLPTNTSQLSFIAEFCIIDPPSAGISACPVSTCNKLPRPRKTNIYISRTAQHGATK